MYIANPLSSLPGRIEREILIRNYQYGRSRIVVIYDATTESLLNEKKKLFTKHFISADIDARDAKSGIGICTVFINRELPIMNSSRKSDGAERHTMFPAVGRHSPVVIHET